MHATPTSNISSRIKATIRRSKTTDADMGPWEPNSVSNKCPAIILAPSRTDSVPGRIIFLTDSIITMIGISAPGVPVGTRWANIDFVWNTADSNILPNQMGKARVNVIEIWLVAVKIYGKSPIKFEKIINKKKLINTWMVPGRETGLNTAINSSSR